MNLNAASWKALFGGSGSAGKVLITGGDAVAKFGVIGGGGIGSILGPPIGGIGIKAITKPH
jgi:hypothetical protein